MRRFLVVALMFAVVLAFPGPASAAVTKSGTKYCSTWQTPYVRSYSTGYTEHFPPGQGYMEYFNGSSWRFRTTYTGGTGGFWIVKTNGSLSNPETYAGCANF